MVFTFIDVIFIIVILALAIHGAINGFVSEFFGKAAVILGIMLSVFFYKKLVPYINTYVDSLFLCNVFSFLIIFVVVYLLVKIIEHFVGAFFENEIMGGLDHTIGFFLGVVEGILVISVLIILLNAQPWFNVAEAFKDSVFYQKLGNVLVVPTETVKKSLKQPSDSNLITGQDISFYEKNLSNNIEGLNV